MANKKSSDFQAELRNFIISIDASQYFSSTEKARLVEILTICTSDNLCLMNAMDNEPIFVLRGQDFIAPQTVKYWTAMFDEAHQSESEPARLFKVKQKIADAEQVVAAMIEYPGRKYPD